MQVDWKLTNANILVEYLRDIVQQQYAELKSLLAGLGELQLIQTFANRHLTSQMQWNAMNNDAKFTKLMKDNG